ncbi:response regulator transcription factor [Carboxylicivirga taeanensis]|uniref:response regulator transcription factor n=1 Tax=Carboxylicivirga taeanensis TaxID=1416875 RepID=UPI003F6DF321
MAKILLVEDDISMGFLLVDFLESNSFDVKLYKDGKRGLEAFKKGKYDFCILDVMLPGMDGFTIAENIRQEDKKIPIIFLTARSMKEDKIKGFQLGVDDYITKPFDEDELLYRIKAILNRTKLQAEPEEDTVTQFTIGSYHFDATNQSLEGNGFSKRLTQKECDVLKILCLSKNKIVKREDILIAIWGENDYFHGRSLDVFIAKLRKYLKGDKSVSIENVPKVGFVLND